MSTVTAGQITHLEEVVRRARIRVAMNLRVQDGPERPSDFGRIVKALRAKVDLLTWMKQEYGIQPVDMGKYYGFPCPFHKEGKKPNGVIYKEKYPIFMCWSANCGVYGDIIDLHARKHGLTRRGAIAELATQHGIQVPRDLFRLQERDKRTYNLWMIKRLPPALSALLRRTAAIYMALLECDERYCMSPEAGLFGEDAGFFQKLDEFQQQLRSDRDTLRQHLALLVAVGVIRIADQELAMKADSERRRRTGRSPHRRSTYYIVPRLTDELVQIAEMKALILQALKGPISADLRDRLTACGDDINAFQLITETEISARSNVLAYMKDIILEVLIEIGGDMLRSDLRTAVAGHGFTNDEMRTHFNRALTEAGVETIYRLSKGATPPFIILSLLRWKGE